MNFAIALAAIQQGHMARLEEWLPNVCVKMVNDCCHEPILCMSHIIPEGDGPDHWTWVDAPEDILKETWTVTLSKFQPGDRHWSKIQGFINGVPMEKAHLLDAIKGYRDDGFTIAGECLAFCGPNGLILTPIDIAGYIDWTGWEDDL